MFKVVGLLVLLVTPTVTAQDQQNLTGGTFAEGYSSPDAATPAELAHRIFTTSSRDCEELETLPTNVQAPREIVVRVGEEFLLTKLVLQATEATGKVIPRAPIALTIAYDPKLLMFENDQDLYFSITGVRAGKAGDLIVQLLCGPDYNIRIPIRVAR
jgi:hypothetical protein